MKTNAVLVANRFSRFEIIFIIINQQPFRETLVNLLSRFLQLPYIIVNIFSLARDTNSRSFTGKTTIIMIAADMRLK